MDVFLNVMTSTTFIVSVVCVFLFLFFLSMSGIRYVSNTRVGIKEKFWSKKGSLDGGKIIALDGEAGYQVDLLRGGLHFKLWRWQYAVHKVKLIVIRQGQLGYVFSRDGKGLTPSQALGKIVDCNNFQDARMFLANGGQRGRQRGILREGVYAINLAIFCVITDDEIYSLEHDRKLEDWQASLRSVSGFSPVLIGHQGNNSVDNIGIITTHDGPAVTSGQIIAPAVGEEEFDNETFHNNYQDIEKFLKAGGRRGLQFTPLIDGTYFINRWFATVELIPKKVVPIGYVGVVVSYYGEKGEDVSGQEFRHGERVGENERGVRQRPLGPGKYAFNTYAGDIVLVPTTNFVLHWVTDRTEEHNYDDNLSSIELVTRDAYEPVLPLSVVVHIDYKNAPSVIQRFGDVKKLITQTLDPLLSAYFRDIAHKKTMLELIHDRDSIQLQGKAELERRFQQFDIACVDVLIGKPDPAEDDSGRIENLLEQLRQRQLSMEQIETYGKQQEAAEKEIALNAARAKALQQEELTRSNILIEITANKASAELEKSKKRAEQTVVEAEAEAKQKILVAEAESQSLKLVGEGGSSKISQIGDAEAKVLLKKVKSFGSPNLYALQKVAEELAQCEQPLVPTTVFSSGDSDGSRNVLEMLISMVMAEKVGVSLMSQPDDEKLGEEPEAVSTPEQDEVLEAVSAPEQDEVQDVVGIQWINDESQNKHTSDTPEIDS
jgi:uncharacterized membrane protein YqiK